MKRVTKIVLVLVLLALGAYPAFSYNFNYDTSVNGFGYNDGEGLLSVALIWLTDLFYQEGDNATLNNLTVTIGYTGDCINASYQSGIVIGCND